jgi:hypothetical protein
VELVVVFVVIPPLLALVPGGVLPSVGVAGGLCLLTLLRDRAFDRKQLWNATVARAFLGSTLLRVALAAAALTVLTLVLAPESLLAFHRYGALFTSQRGVVLASAAAFSFAHVVMRNIPALVVTFVGGLMFAGAYTRTRALALACLEHALLGDFIFTIGLGSFFFDGARSLPGPLRF